MSDGIRDSGPAVTIHGATLPAPDYRDARIAELEAALNRLRDWNNAVRLNRYPDAKTERIWNQAADQVFEILLPLLRELNEARTNE